MTSGDTLKRKDKRGLALQLLFLFLACGALVLAALSSDKEIEKLLPENKIVASTYNIKPSGTSAFLELTQKLFAPNRPVRTWERPYRKLSIGTAKIQDRSHTKIENEPSGVLIIIRPDSSLQEFEVTQIMDWVKKGNYVVYLDDLQYHYSRRLLKKLGISVKHIEPPVQDTHSDERALSTSEIAKPNPVYSHLRVLNLTANDGLIGGEALVKVNGIALIAEKTWGKGKVLVGTCPGMVSNRLVSHVEDWANFQFLCNWITTTRGEIYFDEICHGYQSGNNVYFYFLRGPAGYVLFQLLIVLVLAVLSAHQRFGALTAISSKRKIASSEYILGLSNTYERAKARLAALEIIWQNLFTRLCKSLAISPHDPPERLSESLRARGDKETLEVVELCRSYLAGKQISYTQLKDIVLACDKISGVLDKNPKVSEIETK